MNNHKKARSRVLHQLEYLRQHHSGIVIDADTHITNPTALIPSMKNRMSRTLSYFHGKPISAEELLKEMNLADVDMALSWQNPAATQYLGKPDEDFDSLIAANRYVRDSAEIYPERIIPAGWTDPKALGMDNALKLVDICCNEFGFSIVKVNPAQNEFALDSEEVFTVIARIIQNNAVPAFHYGSDTVYTPPESLVALAERFQDYPLIVIHMGGGGASYIEAEESYLKTRKIGLQFPNLKFVMSAKRDTHMESDIIEYVLAGPPYRDNLFCASDAPYGRQTWNFGGFRAMLVSLTCGSEHTDPRVEENSDAFDSEMVDDMLGGNLATFLIETYERFLGI